jgi:hypothetical protein
LPATGHLSPLESAQELSQLIADFAAAGAANPSIGNAKRINTNTADRV